MKQDRHIRPNGVGDAPRQGTSTFDPVDRPRSDKLFVLQKCRFDSTRQLSEVGPLRGHSARLERCPNGTLVQVLVLSWIAAGSRRGHTTMPRLTRDVRTGATSFVDNQRPTCFARNAALFSSISARAVLSSSW